MSPGHQYALSRRGFCICCAVATGLAATRGWLSPSQAYAEARNVVDLIRDEAAKTPIKVHRLRGRVSVLEGSGGNVAVLTGVDGKVFIDAGITASRRRILEAANGLSGIRSRTWSIRTGISITGWQCMVERGRSSDHCA